MRSRLVILLAPLLLAGPLAVSGDPEAAPAARRAPGPTPPPTPTPTSGPATLDGREVQREIDSIVSGSDYRDLRRHREKSRPAKKKNEGCNGDDDDKSEARPPREPSPGCSAMGGLASVLMYLLLGLVIAGVLALIVWGISKITFGDKDDGEEGDFSGEADEVLRPERPPGEKPSAAYLRRARELAEAGEYRRAIRQLLLGGMSWIERRDLIRFRQGLTNRDYWRALYGRAALQGGFTAMIHEFEEVHFGRREATRDRFELCLSGYQAGFEREDVDAQAP